MTRLYDLKEIVDKTGLPERTVRYYLSEVLEAPAGTPGRKSYYDQGTVDQLLLAQQVLMRDYNPAKGEVKPTLREFRNWLDGLSGEEVRELVQMPYRIEHETLTRGRLQWPARKKQVEQQGEREAQGEASAPRGRVMYSLRAGPDSLQSSEPLDTKSLFDAMESEPARPKKPATNKEDSTATQKTDNHQGGDSASGYLKRVMGRGSKDPALGSRPAPGQWTTHRFGDDLEIRTRQPLDPEQARQLKLAGELIRTILKGTSR